LRIFNSSVVGIIPKNVNSTTSGAHALNQPVNLPPVISLRKGFLKTTPAPKDAAQRSKMNQKVPMNEANVASVISVFSPEGFLSLSCMSTLLR